MGQIKNVSREYDGYILTHDGARVEFSDADELERYADEHDLVTVDDRADYIRHEWSDGVFLEVHATDENDAW